MKVNLLSFNACHQINYISRFFYRGLVFSLLFVLHLFHINFAFGAEQDSKSELLSQIYLQFDLKIVEPPNNPDVDWWLKLETSSIHESVELLIESDIENQQAPQLGEWRTYRFDMLTIVRQGTGINLDALSKILLFPTWGQGDGAKYRVDNISFNIAGSSNREIVFENQINDQWPVWDCCGGSTPQVVLDESKDNAEVIEFTVTNGNGGTVLGFNKQTQNNTRPFNITSLSAEAKKLMESGYDVVSTASADEIYFTHLLTEDINALGAIYSIVKDHQGFIWFGGADGLARYDGYELKTYTHNASDPNSISSNNVWDLLVDQAGYLWVATEQGLNRFDPGSQLFTRFMFDPNDPASLSHNTVKVLFQDTAGSLWVGTYGGGLNRLNKSHDSFTRFKHDNNDKTSISDNEINAITEDSSGVLWVGTEQGLNSYNKETQTFTSYYYYWGNQNSLTDNTIRTIKEDKFNRLWVGAYSGLNLFDRATGSVKRYKFEQLPVIDVVDIAFDGNDHLIIAMGSGIVIFDPDNLTYSHYTNDPFNNNTFEGKFASSMFKDGKDWWFGSFPLGINIIDHNKNRFLTYQNQPTSEASLGHSSVLAISEDEKGNLWLGTDGGGLNYFNRETGQFTRYTKPNNDSRGLNGNAVLSTSFDDSGRLWMSSWNSLISILDLTTNGFIHQTPNFDGLAVPESTFVWKVFTDSQGDIWFGTLGNGLVKKEKATNKYLHYWHDDYDFASPGARLVWSIFEDSRGELWFGTSEGLVRRDKTTGAFTNYQFEEGNPKSLSNNVVLTISEDQWGNLWLGTRGGGLNKFNREEQTFTTFDKQNGLPDNVITAIVHDDNNQMWLSTFNGLCHFDKARSVCRNFRDIGGLETNKFNIGAGVKLSSGELAFGGIGGLVVFDPSSIDESATTSNVKLTDFQLANRVVDINTTQSPLNKDISIAEQIVLDHTQSVFSMAFSALNYRNQDETIYAYFLEGYDDEWNEVGKRRRATYTNLDPGEYLFKVKSTDRVGTWNEPPTTIAITVLPPPWLSWWAYTLYFLILILVIGTIVLLQIRKLQERNQLKLALWASGDELWNADLVNGRVFKQNPLTDIVRPNFESWLISKIEDSGAHPNDRERINRSLQAHVTKQEPHFEFSYRAKNIMGEWVWLLDRGRITSRSINGVPTRISGTTQNIHRLKTAETELLALNEELEQRVKLRTEELKRSNEYLKNAQNKLVESEKLAALGTVVVGVSHELNTPIGIAITALSQLKHEMQEMQEMVNERRLTKGAFGRIKTNTNDSIDLIKSSLDRSVRIIQSFREISVDQANYKLFTYQVRLLIEGAIAEAAMGPDSVLRNKITLNCEEHLQITTYSQVFISVIKQLLVNAKQHAYEDKDKVNIIISVEKNEGDLNITIKDDGKGMNEKELSQLFDPFFTTDRGSNIGLGMFVVYNQVHNILHGSIHCESNVGKGTSLTLRVPIEASSSLV